MTSHNTLDYVLSMHVINGFFHININRLHSTQDMTLTLIPPQELLFMKSTGEVTLGVAGNRSKKSNSTGFTSLFIISTCSTPHTHNQPYSIHRPNFSYSKKLTQNIELVRK